MAAAERELGAQVAAEVLSSIAMVAPSLLRHVVICGPVPPASPATVAAAAAASSTAGRSSAGNQLDNGTHDKENSAHQHHQSQHHQSQHHQSQHGGPGANGSDNGTDSAGVAASVARWSKCLLFMIIDGIVNSQDTATIQSLSDSLKLLLDSDPSSALSDTDGRGGILSQHNSLARTENINFLSGFYDFYLSWLLVPFLDKMEPTEPVPASYYISRGVPVQPSGPLHGGQALPAGTERPPSNTQNSEREDEGNRASHHDEHIMSAIVASRRNIFEILNLCVQQHSYRMKYFAMRNNIISKLLKKSFRSERHQWLVLCGIKFLRTILTKKDEFYVKHLEKLDVLRGLFELFKRINHKDNAVTSGVHDVVECVRVENIKTLVVHIVEKFSDCFVDARHTCLLERLRVRYDQIMDGTYMDGTDDGVLDSGGAAGAAEPVDRSGRAVGDRFGPGGRPKMRMLSSTAAAQQRRFAEVDSEEDYFFGEDDDDDDKDNDNDNDDDDTGRFNNDVREEDDDGGDDSDDDDEQAYRVDFSRVREGHCPELQDWSKLSTRGTSTNSMGEGANILAQIVNSGMLPKGLRGQAYPETIGGTQSGSRDGANSGNRKRSFVATGSGSNSSRGQGGIENDSEGDFDADSDSLPSKSSRSSSGEAFRFKFEPNCLQQPQLFSPSLSLSSPSISSTTCRGQDSLGSDKHNMAVPGKGKGNYFDSMRVASPILPRRSGPAPTINSSLAMLSSCYGDDDDDDDDSNGNGDNRIKGEKGDPGSNGVELKVPNRTNIDDCLVGSVVGGDSVFAQQPSAVVVEMEVIGVRLGGSPSVASLPNLPVSVDMFGDDSSSSSSSTTTTTVEAAANNLTQVATSRVATLLGSDDPVQVHHDSGSNNSSSNTNSSGNGGGGGGQLSPSLPPLRPRFSTDDDDEQELAAVFRAASGAAKRPGSAANQSSSATVSSSSGNVSHSHGSSSNRNPPSANASSTRSEGISSSDTSQSTTPVKMQNISALPASAGTSQPAGISTGGHISFSMKKKSVRTLVMFIIFKHF